MNWVERDENPELAEKIYDRKEFGIYFTIHLDENFNFADMNPYVRKAYLQTLQNVIYNASKINCPIINMHLNRGVYFTLPTEKVFLFEKFRKGMIFE